MNHGITTINTNEVLKIRDLELGALYVYISMLFQECPENMRLSVLKKKLMEHFNFTEKQVTIKLMKLFDLDLDFYSHTGSQISIPENYASNDLNEAHIVKRDK